MTAQSSNTNGDGQGTTVQTRMFAGIGAFFFLLAIVYWFVSYEEAGTTMLALAGGLATLTAGYFGIARTHPAVDAAEPAGTSPGHGPEEPWFPHASVWPLAIGAGAALVANAILLGLWMLLPAGFVLAGAIIGFSHQSRQRA